MGRSDFREAIRPGHASLAAILRREKPDALQDCRCTPRQTAAPYRATMEAFHDMRLDSRTFETRSRPALTHVLPPISTCRFAHLCRTRPASPFARRYPRL